MLLTILVDVPVMFQNPECAADVPVVRGVGGEVKSDPRCQVISSD